MTEGMCTVHTVTEFSCSNSYKTTFMD